MEVRGVVHGVTVIDDFAHHPTAVRETIDAVRQRYPDSRIIAVFEPRSYTAQRREFQEPYRAALAAADIIILAGLFHPERYTEATALDPHQLVGDLGAAGRRAEYIPATDDIVARIIPDLRSGDVVLVMSNGAFGGIHQKLLGALQDRVVAPGA